MMIGLIGKLRFLQVGAIPKCQCADSASTSIPASNLEIPDSDSFPRAFWVRLAAFSESEIMIHGASSPRKKLISNPQLLLQYGPRMRSI